MQSFSNISSFTASNLSAAQQSSQTQGSKQSSATSTYANVAYKVLTEQFDKLNITTSTLVETKVAEIPNEIKIQKELQNLADLGDALGQYLLGRSYETESGFRPYWPKSLDLYLKAANQEYAPAQYRLAIGYMDGNFDFRGDEEEALKWMKKAAINGYVEAQRYLGNIYHNAGYRDDKYYQEAVKWFKMAAEQGSAEDQFYLAFCYEHGRGVQKDSKAALELFLKAANGGHKSAQNWVALLLKDLVYDHEKNIFAMCGKLTKEELQKLAEKGFVQAQYLLGKSYESMRLVHLKPVELTAEQKDIYVPDWPKSVDWYLKAANQGYVPAQYKLALGYSEGYFEDKRDYAKALVWFTKPTKSCEKI